MRELIEHAIRNRLVIALEYPPGQRLIEPHALGYSSTGNEILRAYQTEGASASGESQWWKLFRVDRIASAAAAGVVFDGPRPGYRQGDSHMKRGIICEL
jgi:hypothetical protein